MKKSLLTIFALAIAVGPVLGEDEKDKVKQPKSRSHVAPAPPRRVNPPAPRTMPPSPKVQQNVNVSPRFRNKVLPPTNRVNTPNVRATNAPAPNRTFNPPDRDAVRPPKVRSDVDLSNGNWRNRTRNQTPPKVIAPQTPPTTDTTVQSDTNKRNRDWRNRDDQDRNRNRDWRNRTDNNRNWRNYNPSGTYTYDQARRRHHRQRHDRGWWRSRYNRIALFAGGYYYWDNNYWYPAYGYDPYYSTYTYDEPIYGYGDLQPGQVIANVQQALQEQGYYDDQVDGLIGPRTRAALRDFQRDNGLPVTAAIDGPTLKALGLY
jgi:hypothetical protein